MPKARFERSFPRVFRGAMAVVGMTLVAGCGSSLASHASPSASVSSRQTEKTAPVPSSHAASGAAQGSSSAPSSSSGASVVGSSSSPSPAKTSPVVSVSPWLRYNPSTKEAYLTVVSGYNGVNGGYNFDGAANGFLVVRIPTGWRVTVVFHNNSIFAHSLAVVADAGATAPAFSGAGLSSDALTAGINQGQTVKMQFVAGAPGTYRLACLVPSHEADGMWDRFIVTSGGLPSIGFGGQ